MITNRIVVELAASLIWGEDEQHALREGVCYRVFKDNRPKVIQSDTYATLHASDGLHIGDVVRFRSESEGVIKSFKRKLLGEPLPKNRFFLECRQDNGDWIRISEPLSLFSIACLLGVGNCRDSALWVVEEGDSYDIALSRGVPPEDLFA